jgi:hypothetical protein
VALGTNTVASAAMKQAGAMKVGIGPYGGRDCHFVEFDTGNRSRHCRHTAMKVLLPLNRVRVEIVGVRTGTLDALIDQSLLRGPFFG